MQQVIVSCNCCSLRLCCAYACWHGYHPACWSTQQLCPLCSQHEAPGEEKPAGAGEASAAIKVEGFVRPLREHNVSGPGVSQWVAAVCMHGSRTALAGPVPFSMPFCPCNGEFRVFMAR